MPNAFVLDFGSNHSYKNTLMKNAMKIKKNSDTDFFQKLIYDFSSLSLFVRPNALFFSSERINIALEYL